LKSRYEVVVGVTEFQKNNTFYFKSIGEERVGKKRKSLLPVCPNLFVNVSELATQMR
jgi:hypothetical protein